MKVAIWDGSSDGMFSAGQVISKHREGNGRPYAICEVPQDLWDEWETFLEQYGKWEQYWDNQQRAKENRSR